MKKVLLTGATGFIGRHCLELLSARDCAVHAVSSKPPPAGAPQGVRWHRADLLDSARTAELLARVEPTHLLHLAWYVEPKLYWHSPENLRWVAAGLELLRQFAARGGRRMVAAGTCAEYDWQYGCCSEQVTPLAPATLYGVCKCSLQAIMHSFAAQGGLSAAWGRIFFLYGPHEHPERLVPSVIRALLRREPALCSHGAQIRDFLYVRDAAAAFVALLDSEVSGPVNIASGAPVTLKQVIEEAARMIGRPELVRLGARPAPAGEPALLLADTARLNREVGWRPAYTLERGLAETIAWWKGNRGDGS